MLVFYNLNVDALECYSRKGSHSVEKVLGLKASDWTCNFAPAKVVDVAVGGVSIDYRRKQSEFAACVFSVAFVLIERNGVPFDNRIEYCTPTKELNWYPSSSVAFCAFRGSRLSLETCSAQRKVGLHVLQHHLEYPSSILDQLAKMVFGHREKMIQCCPRDKTQSEGKLRRHSEWNDGIAKTLQRISNTASWESGKAPLSCCPCLLGNSDPDEWATLDDPCAATNVSMKTLLRNACSCGRISFRPYTEASIGHVYRIPEKEIKSVLVHTFKEQIMQELVGGEVELFLRGHMNAFLESFEHACSPQCF